VEMKQIIKNAYIST